MPAKCTGKKAQAKAKSEAAAKRQKTCAKADSVAEGAELDGAIVLGNAGMGALQFHKTTTKMRNLLKYRDSDKCSKAYIYLYMQAFREAY